MCIYITHINCFPELKSGKLSVDKEVLWIGSAVNTVRMLFDAILPVRQQANLYLNTEVTPKPAYRKPLQVKHCVTINSHSDRSKLFHPSDNRRISLYRTRAAVAVIISSALLLTCQCYASGSLRFCFWLLFIFIDTKSIQRTTIPDRDSALIRHRPDKFWTSPSANLQSRLFSQTLQLTVDAYCFSSSCTLYLSPRFQVTMRNEVH